jgi:energy-coupling factor transporter transmembrane protein EcfT
MRNYSAVLGPLMINSLRIAQQLALAVETKALGSSAKKTSLKELKLTSFDKQVLVGYGVLMVVVITLRVLGYGAFQL